MKKKTLYILIGAFVAVAIALLLIFVFSGNVSEDMKQVEIDGTWEVVVSATNNTPALVENQFMTFDGETADVYRDGEIYASSTYSISGNMLSLPDISRKYSIEAKTENHIRLYENEKVYMELVRYPNADLSEVEIDHETIYGKWDVAYRNASDPVANEVLAFSEDQIEDYRDGASEPAAVSSYSWVSDDVLLADKWGIEFKLYQLSADVIFFVETATGLIWELHRVA